MHFRYIRTLRTALRRWWHSNNTFKWVEAVRRLTNTYNHTVSRTHKEKPVAVLIDKEAALRAYKRLVGFGRQKPPVQVNVDKRIKEGSIVRISRLRGTFEKESTYLGLWSRDLYRVVRIYKNRPRIVYRLESITGAAVRGKNHLQFCESCCAFSML